MKLEPGKYYKTRDGSKAWVGCIAPEELDINDEFQVLGYVLSDGVWCQSTWDINGRLQGEECDSDPDDLVSEWTEPEEVEVTIYRTPGGNILVYQGEPMEGQEDMFKIVKKLKVALD